MSQRTEKEINDEPELQQLKPRAEKLEVTFYDSGK